jgi:hypothetical protein
MKGATFVALQYKCCDAIKQGLSVAGGESFGIEDKVPVSA